LVKLFFHFPTFLQTSLVCSQLNNQSYIIQK
jgi:hypothetical protein